MSLLAAMAQYRSAATDPSFASVAALLHYNGINGGTAFYDQKGNTWTRYGGTLPTISTAQYAFNGSSGAFNGSNGVSAPHVSAFDFGTGDLTIEQWIYPLSVASGADHIAHRNGADNSNFWHFRVNSGGALRFEVKSAGSAIIDLTTSGTLAANAGVHVAYVRASGVSKIFIAGVSQTLTGSDSAAAFPVVNYPLWIGAGDDSLTGAFNGYVDETRITVGVARYTSNFTPPTAPFPNS